MAFLALFFLSICVFSFQTLLSPTFSTLFAGSSLHLIMAPAWLAFAAGFGLWCLLPRKFRSGLSTAPLALRSVGALTIISLLASLILIKLQQEGLNRVLVEYAKSTSDRLLEPMMAKSYKDFLMPTVFATILPFFFYSLFLSVLLSRISAAKVGSFFAVEFAGIAVGMISTAALLDGSGSWVLTACFSFISGLIALASLLDFKKNLKFAVKIGALLLVAGIGCHLISELEPGMPLNISARDFKFREHIIEKNKAWNSFSKVQTLETEFSATQMISLGNGTGIAWLPKINDRLTLVPQPATVQISLALQPHKILILFAGAGAEIPAFEKYSYQPVEVTGVELNPAVIQQALAADDQGLATYLQRPNVALLNSDARQYLESTDKTFDLILFSWAGATVAHYSGAIVHTTQFVLTKEALAKAISRLAPGGSLVIMPGSKVNILASLQELKQQGKIKDLKNQVALLAFNDRPGWRKNWDNNVLIFKNSALSHEDLDRLEKAAGELSAKIVISPFAAADPDFGWHQKLIESDSPTQVLNEIDATEGLRFSSFDDDRPFVFHNTDRLIDRGLACFKGQLEGATFREFFVQRPLFLMVVFAASLLLFATLLLAARKKGLRVLQLWSFHLSAYGLGLTGAGLQLAFMYRWLMFLGNPTYALIFSSLIWAGGSALAASCLKKLTEKKLPMLLLISLSLVFYIAAILFTDITAIKEVLFGFNFTLRALVLAAIALPAVFGSGLLFPLLLQRAQPVAPDFMHRLVALDALAAAVGVLAVPLMIEDYGISIVVYALLAVFMLSSGLLFRVKSS